MGLVIAFNLRKSMQKRFEPSFFGTITIGLLQGEDEGRIMSAANMSSMALSTTGLFFKGVK